PSSFWVRDPGPVVDSRTPMVKPMMMMVMVVMAGACMDWSGQENGYANEGKDRKTSPHHEPLHCGREIFEEAFARLSASGQECFRESCVPNPAASSWQPVSSGDRA